MSRHTAITDEPHEPTPGERRARDLVRRRAGGMAHHEAAEALEAAEETAGDLETAEAGARAEVAEWRRITDLLFDHGGPYTPETDAYVQGQLTARENRRDRADRGEQG